MFVLYCEATKDHHQLVAFYTLQNLLQYFNNSTKPLFSPLLLIQKLLGNCQKITKEEQIDGKYSTPCKLSSEKKTQNLLQKHKDEVLVYCNIKRRSLQTWVDLGSLGKGFR